MVEVVIADISKAFPNTTQQTLEAVRAYCVANGVDASSVSIVARPDHASAQRDFMPSASWVFTPDASSAVGLVVQLLHRLSGPKSVMVLSFSPEVWRLARLSWSGLSVRAQHVFGPPKVSQPTFAQPLAPLVVAGPEPAWTFEHVSSLPEALQGLKQVLQTRGALSSHSALRQTTLRPWLGIVNPSRFSGSAASTNSAGMIGLLLRIAAVRQLVDVAGTNPGDLFVWLRPETPARQGDDSQLAFPKTIPEPVAAVESVEEPQTRLQSPSHSPSSVSTVRPTESRRLPKRIREPDKYVSDRMSENIERQRMGPFPMARPYVFAAVEQCVNSGSNLPLSALVEAAVRKGVESMMAEGLTPPLGTALRFVTERQLLRSGAVLDEQGRPLPNSWSSGSIPVHRLAVNWMLKAEGEILIALFGVQEITGDQLVDIARSVWGGSSAEAVSKVQRVLAHLFEAPARIQEDERGVFRPTRSQAHDPQPAATTVAVVAVGIAPTQESTDIDAEDDEDQVH